MAWAQDEINEVYGLVMHKASSDEEFRRSLLENPNQAIEKLTGEKLPDGFKVKVLENDPNYSATFVLPQFLDEDLSIDELENVAGGVDMNVNACGAQAQVRVKGG